MKLLPSLVSLPLSVSSFPDEFILPPFLVLYRFHKFICTKVFGFNVLLYLLRILAFKELLASRVSIV